MAAGPQTAGDPDDNVVPLRRAEARDVPWRRFDPAAERDEFTSLAGHPWFVEDLRGAAKRRRGGDNPWVAIASARGLDGIGARAGGDAAGLALQAVAVHLHESLRGGDHVARIGPNRFGLLINAPYADETAQALERLRQRVRELVGEHPPWGGLDLVIGYTSLWSGDPLVAIRNASEALERACAPGAPAVFLSTHR